MSKELPRKKQEYQKLQKQLMEDLKIANTMALPKLTKIVINIGAGKAKDDNSLLEQLQEDVTNIAGQKPVVTKSRKAIANFKLRENQPVGVMVTLRGNRMWEFFDKFVSVVLPRVKDFRGVSATAFDTKGNYSVGLKDQSVFPEVDTTKVIKYHPLQVVFCVDAPSKEASQQMFKLLGMPFRKN